MKSEHAKHRTSALQIAALIAALFSLVAVGFAQAPPPPGPPPAPLPPAELDQLVSRIALYPDPLLAQVLAASTYYEQIPDAAAWADQHHYLNGQALANAIQADQVPWDPSVQALLPFPSVLETMAGDMAWTTQLGNAYLAQPNAVEDAIQTQRHLAYQYGYLRSNPQVAVTGGPYITIAPVNPGYIVVPAYDPGVVFFAPRPGFVVGGAIHFGFGVTIGGFFAPWGWGGIRWDWAHHGVFIGGAPWGRTWGNRFGYVHPGFSRVHRFAPAQRAPERHALERRSPAERAAPRAGRAMPREEHRGGRR